MERLIVSAPFGNRLSFPHATSTLGTYTREFRAGALRRWWRVLRTVRYYPGIGAWKNKLGLPNRGIDWLAGQVQAGRVNAADKIVSVSARESWDWNYLLGCLEHVIRPGWVELNVSCPSCPGEPDRSFYPGVFAVAAGLFPGRVIVKLPPVGYAKRAVEALVAGVTCFHCCNTLPTPGGGLSGKPLKALSLEACREVKGLAEGMGIRLGHLIGGGGVTGMQDVKEYHDAGADRVAVGSVLFFPWRRAGIRKMAGTLAKNAARARAAVEAQLKGIADRAAGNTPG